MVVVFEQTRNSAVSCKTIGTTCTYVSITLTLHSAPKHPVGRGNFVANEKGAVGEVVI
jgi:hypothetical protein